VFSSRAEPTNIGTGASFPAAASTAPAVAKSTPSIVVENLPWAAPTATLAASKTSTGAA
jgi:hypothetical protein